MLVIIMIAHIVPQVYLKSWANKKSKNSVYVFDRETFNFEPKNLDVLSKTNFQKKDEYLLNIEDCCLEIYSKLFDELYDNLKNKYQIQYKDRIIFSSYQFRNYCRNLTVSSNDWVIIELKNNLRYKYRAFREEVIQMWNNNFQREIEDFFSKNYENSWEGFLSYLNGINVNSQERMISLDDTQRSFIIEFLAIQLTRKYTNFNMFKQIIEHYMSMIDLGTELNDALIKKLWLSDIFKFILYKDGNNEKYKNCVINYMINYLNSRYISYELYISDNIDFLTSDNPVFRYESFVYNEDDYIYFPINRNMCLGICSKSTDNDLFKFKKISSAEVKIINNLIIENAEKHFICYDTNYKEKII